MLITLQKRNIVILSWTSNFPCLCILYSPETLMYLQIQSGLWGCWEDLEFCCGCDRFLARHSPLHATSILNKFATFRVQFLHLPAIRKLNTSRLLLHVFDQSENVLKLARPFRVIYSMHTHDVVEQRTTRRKEDGVQYFSRMVCMMSEGACSSFYSWQFWRTLAPVPPR